MKSNNNNNSNIAILLSSRACTERDTLTQTYNVNYKTLAK